MENDEVRSVCEPPQDQTADISLQTDRDASESAVEIKPNKRGRLICFFKTFGFLMVVLATLVGLYFGGRPNIPGPTRTYRTYTLNKMFSERKNSLDVLYVGHSGVFCGVSPMELYEDYGFAGYNCSQELFVPWESYETTLDILEEQKPKVIALEVDQFFYDSTKDLTNSHFKRLALCLFPFRETHNYWRDGFKRSERDFKKNFSVYAKIKPHKGSTERQYTRSEYKLKKAHAEYLRKFAELCAARDIKLALFYLPSLRYWSYDKYNCIKAFADKNGLDYFDMNVDAEVASDADKKWNKSRVSIDWAHDTRDGGDHLNYYGAMKSTAALGEWLETNCDIPDRRGDEAYSDWKRDLEKYKSEVDEKIFGNRDER